MYTQEKNIYGMNRWNEVLYFKIQIRWEQWDAMKTFVMDFMGSHCYRRTWILKSEYPFLMSGYLQGTCLGIQNFLTEFATPTRREK